MELSRRPGVYELPSYSLTADLLGFMRCGLQYRYTRIGRQTPSRPVQMWFGQFIHGVLEEGFRRFSTARASGDEDPPPWDPDVVQEMCDLVKQRLASQGLHAWDQDLEALGDLRATSVINELGPSLFPLVHRAEVRLTGSRLLPPIDPAIKFREADRYEMVGVVDVITHVELADPALADNVLVRILQAKLESQLPPVFELIVDYKGMRRPASVNQGRNTSLWEIYGWQLQTYAHLRSAQPDHLPVAAGMILYVNELVPTATDIRQLRREITDGTTDVVPDPGSLAEEQLAAWKEVGDPLPLEFRLARAMRVVPVSDETIATALGEFDSVVERIETCRGNEVRDGSLIQAWEQNSEDESTCSACDSRTYCPAYDKVSAPRLPG